MPTPQKALPGLAARSLGFPKPLTQEVLDDPLTGLGTL